MSSNGYGNPYYYEPSNTYANGAPTSKRTNYNTFTQPGLYNGTFGDFSQQPQEPAPASAQAAMPFGNNYINQPMQNASGYPNGINSPAATRIDLDAAEPAKEVQAQTQPRKKRAYTKRKPVVDLQPGAAADQDANKAPKSAKGQSKKIPKAKESADQATDRMMRALENEEKREAKAEKKKQQQAKPPPRKKPSAPNKGTTDPKPAQKQVAIPESQPKLATKVQPEQGDLKEIRKAHQKSKPDAGVKTNTDPVDLEDDSNDSPHASEGWQRAKPKVVCDETKIPRIMPDDYSQLPDGRVKKTYNGREKVTLVFGQYDFDDSTELSLDFFGSADGTVTLVLNGKLDLNKIDGDIMTDERDFLPEDEEDFDDPNGYIAPEDMLPTLWEHPEENVVQQQPTPDDSSKYSASPSGNLAKGTKRPRDEDTGNAGGSKNASKKQKQKQTLDYPSDDEGDGIYAPSGPGAPAKRKKAKQMNAKQQKEILAHLRARNEMFERVKRGLPAQEPSETNEPARPFESRAAATTTVPAAVAGAEMANAEVTAPLIQLEESEESDADDDDPEYKRHPDYGKPIPETPAPQPSNEPALDDIDEAEFRRLFNEPDNLADSSTNTPAAPNVVNGTGVQPAYAHNPGPGHASRKHSRSDDNDYEGPMPHKKIARKMEPAT